MQHLGRTSYPSVAKHKAVLPCRDIPTSHPQRCCQTNLKRSLIDRGGRPSGGELPPYGKGCRAAQEREGGLSIPALGGESLNPHFPYGPPFLGLRQRDSLTITMG